MCMKKHNKSMVGKTFGNIEVLEQIPTHAKKSGRLYYKYKINCRRCNEISIMGNSGITVGMGSCRKCSYAQRDKGILNPNTIDLSGKKFGKLTVISISEEREKHQNRLQWVCACDCGKTKTISGQKLKDGSVTSCGCGQGKKGQNSPFWSGHGEIAGGFWSKIKYTADDRKLPFLLTIEEAWDLFLKQDRKCALTGIPIQLLKPKTASLDRIDSSKGYTKDNVQWVHKDVNFLKGKFSEKDLYKWCELLLSYRNEKSK